MKESSIEQLVANMERNDKRFRISQTIFMVLAGCALVLLFALQLQTERQFQQQSAQRAIAITGLEKHNDAQLRLVTGYIQCIAQFFATTDRTNKTLTDLDNCSITQDGAKIPGVNSTPSTDQYATDLSNTLPTGNGANKNLQGSNGSYIQPAANEIQEPAKQPEQEPDSQPLAVLGIPVCTPWAQICDPILHVTLGL